jgi:hypothetical protein
MTRRWEKVTGIAGILTAVTLLAELFTWSNPQMTDSMSKVKDYFVHSGALASVSIWLAAMLTLPLFVFAIGLRASLRREEGAADPLPAIFLAAAAAFASVQLVFGSISGALVLAAPKATDGSGSAGLGSPAPSSTSRLVILQGHGFKRSGWSPLEGGQPSLEGRGQSRH